MYTKKRKNLLVKRTKLILHDEEIEQTIQEASIERKKTRPQFFYLQKLQVTKNEFFLNLLLN